MDRSKSMLPGVYGNQITRKSHANAAILVIPS